MSATTQAPAPPAAISIVESSGVRREIAAGDLKERISAGHFFWVDLCNVAPSDAAALLRETGSTDADVARALQFGQAGRIAIGRHGIRAVTWMAQPPNHLVELHFRASADCIVTLWHGDPTVLGEARRQFADRVESLQNSPFHAAAIVLQLLLGTVYHVIGHLDEAIDRMSEKIADQPDALSFGELRRERDLLRAGWLKLERYSAAVRSATVGVDAIPGIAEHGVQELDDYAEAVEDLASSMAERFQWASTVVQDYRVTLAQREGEQINRLAIVSIFFLPITFLTGFFGMNFQWMLDRIQSPGMFVGLGLVLPLVSVIATAIWLRRRLVF